MYCIVNLLKKVKKDFYSIVDLSLHETLHRFSGSVLGIVWLFTKPILTISIFLFVFEYGLKTNPTPETSFTSWFLIGIIPWFYISEVIISGGYSILEYRYLIKKMSFNKWLIPAIKIFSATYIHLIFIIISAILIYILDAVTLNVVALYYFLCSIILVSGFAYLLSAFIPFFPDLKQIVDIIMQVLFWLTPIIWDYRIFPDEVVNNLRYNPFFYIVEGYRDALIYKQGISFDYYDYIFLLQVIFIWILGWVSFKKLKSHFNEVL